MPRDRRAGRRGGKMKGRTSMRPQLGCTLIELITALGIFLVICGAAFMLLTSSQKQYQTESQVLNSFQEARLGLDQIVRDVNDAGYPPPTYVSTDPAFFAATPFAWSPGYPNAPCQIATGGGGNCATATAGDTAPAATPGPTRTEQLTGRGRRINPN